MKQEMELLKTNRLYVSSLDILTGQLLDGEKIYFQSYAIAEDNDCGFHVLGLDRVKAVTQLLTNVKNEKLHQLIAPEIQAAFIEGTLPKEMQTDEWKNLHQAYDQAWEKYRLCIAEVKEKIRNYNESHVVAIQSFTPDDLIAWLDQQKDYVVLKEQLLKARLEILFLVERQLEVYSEKEATFVAFIQHYLDKGGWLTYIGNLQNKTQQTSSLDALAELNRIQLFIWQANPSNLQQLHLVHQYGKLEYPAIHMLHTHGMTHYDLLQKVENSNLIINSSSSIPLGKQEEELFASSLMSSLDNNKHLLVSSEEKQDSIQLSLQVKKIIEEIKQAKAQGKVDYALQAESFIKLGNYYLGQHEYLYAAAIFNYVLNIYRLRLAKNEEDKKENNKTEQAKPSFQKEQQTIIEKLIAIESQFIIELSISLQKTPVDVPHSYLKINTVHQDYLEQLREDCKKRLAEIDSQYPFDIYDEGKAKGHEDKYQQLQLEKAERIHNLYHDIAERLKAFVRQLIQECIEVLGSPPCDYAMLGLGSLAREEVTPYSDLEFAILIAEEKENYKQYFRNLTKLLHLKVINLGEAILPAMGIPALNNYYSKDPLDNWFYDEVTPRGFAFDGAMPQACKTPLGKKDVNGNVIYELIYTPEEMAKFQGKKANDSQDWFAVEPHLPNILSCGILIMGNPELLKDYEQTVRKKLNELDKDKLPLRQTRAISLLIEDSMEFDPRLGEQSEEGKLYIAKQALYRLVSIIIDRLALFLDLDGDSKQQDVLNKDYWRRLDFLCELGYLNKHARNNLKIVISLATEIRLRTYLANNSQQEKLIFSTRLTSNKVNVADIKQIFHISELFILFRYYFTALPLYEVIKESIFVKLQDLKKRLSNNNLFDNTERPKAFIYKRLLLYKESKKSCKAWLNDHKKDWDIQELLAQTLMTTGKYQSAEEKFTKLLKKCRGQPRLIGILSNLGVICDINKDFLKAEKYAKDALDLTHLLGQHATAEFARYRINLGLTYHQMAKYEDALRCFNEAKQIQDKAINSKIHLDKAVILECFGLVFKELGDYNQAIKYFNDALIMQNELFAMEFNPFVANTLQNLGVVYQMMGNYQIALEHYTKSFNIYKEIFENNSHPKLIELYDNIGQIHGLIGEFKKAEMYHERSMQKSPHLLSKAASAENLGCIYMEQGVIDWAEYFLKSSLESRRKIFKEILHPSILSTLINLAALMITAGREADATKYFQEARDNKSALRIKTDLLNIEAILLFNQKKYNEALELRQQAEKDYLTIYTNGVHPKIALNLDSIGLIYESLKDYKNAEEYFLRSLEMLTIIYPNKKHADISSVKLNLAGFLERRGGYGLSITIYNEILQIQKEIYGKRSNLLTAAALHELGRLHAKLKKYDSSFKYLSESLSIQRQLFSNKPHPKTANTLANLALWYLEQKNYNAAVDNFNQAYDMHQQLANNRLWGENNKDIVRLRQNALEFFLVLCPLKQQELIIEIDSYRKKLFDILSSHTNQLLELSLLSLEQGKLLGANICYEKILSLKPNYFYAHFELGWLHYSQAQLAKTHNDTCNYAIYISRSEQHYSKAYELMPRSDICSSFAFMLYQEHKYEKTIIYCLKSISNEVTNLLLNYDKNKKIIVEHDLQVEIDFWGAINIKPNVLAYKLLVSTYVNLDQFSEAEEYLKEFAKAVKTERDSLSFVLLGHAYQRLKYYKEAIEAYQTAIQYYQSREKNPKYTLAYNYIEQCEEKIRPVTTQNISTVSFWQSASLLPKNAIENNSRMQEALTLYQPTTTKSEFKRLIKKACQLLIQKAYQEAELQLIAALKIPCDINVISNDKETDLQQLATVFTHLGDLYLGKNLDKKLYLTDFSKATAFYQLALTIYQLHLKPQSNSLLLEKKLFSVVTSFLTVNGLQEIDMEVWMKQGQDNKKSLLEIRADVKTQLKPLICHDNSSVQGNIKKPVLTAVNLPSGKEEEPNNNQLLSQTNKLSSTQQLYHFISSSIKKFICQLLEQCYALLGKPKCLYAIIGLGSLARQEMTPYSDFEFAILIERDDEEIKRYFRNLTTLLHLKVIQLGETIIPALNIEKVDELFFDSITPRGFAFDGAMPQACKTPLGKRDINGNMIYELIHTPEEMAKFQGKKLDDSEQRYWFEIEKHLPIILTNITLIEGEESLVADYKTRLVKFLQEDHSSGEKLHVYLAKRLLQEDLKEFAPQLGANDLEGRLFEAKRDLYRMPQIFLDRLALLYSLSSSTSWERINELLEKKIITPEGASQWLWVISETTKFRLMTYCAYNAQKEFINPLIKAFQLDNENLYEQQVQLDAEEVAHLQQIYQILMSLYEAIKQLTLGDDSLLKSSNLKDESIFTQGKIAARICDYEQAKLLFQQAYAKDKNNIIVANSLANVLNTLDESQEIINLLCPLRNQPHATAVENKVSLLNNLGLAYHRQNNLSEAKRCFEEALENIEKIIEEKSGFYAVTYNNLGLIDADLGLHSEAINHYDKALSWAQPYYGKDHPNVCLIERNKASVHLKKGEYKKTIVYYMHVYRVHNKFYGEIHPKIAEDLMDQAAFWREVGHFTLAVEHVKKALRINQNMFGNKHISVASALNNLAVYQNELGQFEEAKQNSEQALDILTYKFGETGHPLLAINLCNLANIEFELNFYDQAERHFQQGIAILQILYDNQHPDLPLLMSNFAEALKKLGRFDQAKQFYQKALPILESFHQSESPDLQLLYNNIGGYYFRLGNVKEAIRYLIQSIEVCEKYYGKNHYTTARVKNNLGKAYLELNKLQEAEQTFLESLQIEISIFGGKHPSVAITYGNLGSCYRAMSNIKKAIHYTEKALDISLNAYNKNHPIIAQHLNNLGACYYQLANFKLARSYYTCALTIAEACYGKKHIEVAITLSNIALTLLNQQSLAVALEYLQQAHRIATHFYQQSHPNIVKMLINLADAYRRLVKRNKTSQLNLNTYLDKAMMLNDQAFQLLLNLDYDEDHELYGYVYNNKGLILYEKKDLLAAKYYFYKAYEILKTQLIMNQVPDYNHSKELKTTKDSIFKCQQKIAMRIVYKNNYIKQAHHLYFLKNYEEAFKNYFLAWQLYENEVENLLDKPIKKEMANLAYRMALCRYHKSLIYPSLKWLATTLSYYPEHKKAQQLKIIIDSENKKDEQYGLKS